MEIQTFTESLQKKLKAIISGSEDDDLIAAGRKLSNIREIVSELKNFTEHYTFINKDEEILFFKERKPILLSQYIFHKKVLTMKLFNTFRDKKSITDNYYKVLRKMKLYIERNRTFYKYCISGESHLDQLYFTRNKSNPLNIAYSENFSTGHDIILAKLLANEMTLEFIRTELSKFHDAERKKTNLIWTGSKSDLIELGYALQAVGAFNNSTMNAQNILQAFEKIFQIELGNYARMFHAIRMRKSKQTAFIDELKNRLEQRIKEIEER